MNVKQKIYWFLSGLGLHILFIAVDLRWQNSFFNIKRLYAINNFNNSNIGSLFLTVIFSIIFGGLIFLVTKKNYGLNFSRNAGIYLASGFIVLHLILFIFLSFAFRNF